MDFMLNRIYVLNRNMLLNYIIMVKCNFYEDFAVYAKLYEVFNYRCSYQWCKYALHKPTIEPAAWWNTLFKQWFSNKLYNNQAKIDYSYYFHYWSIGTLYAPCTLTGLRVPSLWDLSMMMTTFIAIVSTRSSSRPACRMRAFIRLLLTTVTPRDGTPLNRCVGRSGK